MSTTENEFFYNVCIPDLLIFVLGLSSGFLLLLMIF